MEVLKVKEWWSTFESYNGWRMAGVEMAQPTKPWPEYQHELGGARVYYIDRAHWQTLKPYAAQMIGQDFNFQVTDEVRKANENFHAPEKVDL
jgi:hypothetical protein